MRYIKNEDGVALVTVILIFTVFTILGMVVFSATLNNTKQITKTETEIQATDLAEMGITFYRTIVQKSIMTVFTAPTNISDMNTQLSKLKTEITKTGSRKVISDADVYFEMNNLAVNFDSTNNEMIILLDSIGTVKNDSRPLNLKLTYSFNKDSDGAYTITIPITGLSPVSVCGTTLTNSTTFNNGSTCAYNISGNDASEDDDIKSINNVVGSTIYLTGDLDMSGQIVNVDGGRIYIKGNLNTDALVNFQHTSIVGVEKTAYIDSINNTSGNFSLYIGEDLHVSKINNIVNTTIFVNGTVYLDPSPQGTLSMDTTTSRICAGTAVKYEGGASYTNTASDGVYIRGDGEFESKCSRYSLVNFSPDEQVEYK